jgi:hypothetical protein
MGGNLKKWWRMTRNAKKSPGGGWSGKNWIIAHDLEITEDDLEIIEDVYKCLETMIVGKM